MEKTFFTSAIEYDIKNKIIVRTKQKASFCDGLKHMTRNIYKDKTDGTLYVKVNNNYWYFVPYTHEYLKASTINGFTY